MQSTSPSLRVGYGTLGVPTVVDRLIQQALLQVLQPLFEPHFSESSYGFRPGRNAWQAVQAARDHVRRGKGWVADIDLAKFFDRVNHDVLMARVAREVKDGLSNIMLTDLDRELERARARLRTLRG